MAAILETLRQDLTYAVRALRRSPGLTSTILITLGLGIGANAAVFATLDRVFFQAPGGVLDPGSIRRLYAHNYTKKLPEYGPDGTIVPWLSTRDLKDLSDAIRGVARLEGDYLYRQAKLTPSGEPLLITYVSPGYFDLLGVRPAHGRFFGQEENQLFGPPVPVAVVSDVFWRSHFASDPTIIGKTIRIDEAIYTVVGVAPRSFEGLELELVDVWLPLPNIQGGDVNSLRLLARLEPGTDSRLLDEKLTAQYRQTHSGDPYVEDRSRILTASILASRGPTQAAYRIPLMTDRSLALLPRLAVASLAVLVIAIANVASLLLMRAVKRRREIMIRLALGISRRRLVTQLLTESMILGITSAAVALLIAASTGNLLRSQLATLRWTSDVVDERVVVFAMAVAIISGVAAGLAPAWLALRPDLGSFLTTASRDTRGGSGVRATLLVVQAALCTALVACGGAFLQSLRRSTDFDRGFDPDRVLIVSVPSFIPNADAEFATVAERIRGIPGVEAAGRSMTGLGSVGFQAMVGTSSHDTIGVSPRGPSIEFVEPDFLNAVGHRVLLGRLLTAADKAAPVAVITESLANQLWPRGQAVGSCFYIRAPRVECRTVVGVVRDLRWFDVGEVPILRVYIPIEQAWVAANRSFMPNQLHVRIQATATASDVNRLRTIVGPMLAGGESDLSVWRVASLLEPQRGPWLLAASLFLLLGGLGLGAAAAGIYGLVAYDVTQRTQELGIRIALGAPSRKIVHLVVGSGLRVVLLGVAAGAVASLAIGRIMSSLLFETSPYDPMILIATALILGIAAMLASVYPAWRAVHLDPARVLSSD